MSLPDLMKTRLYMDHAKRLRTALSAAATTAANQKACMEAAHGTGCRAAQRAELLRQAFERNHAAVDALLTQAESELAGGGT